LCNIPVRITQSDQVHRTVSRGSNPTRPSFCLLEETTMLKNIPAILGPELLYALRAMGHGDEIAIVDANYPADSAGPSVIRLDGISATDVLEAVLTLMPLDT